MPGIPQSLADSLVGLMQVSDDHQMWRDRYASILERVAEQDDLTLLLEGMIPDDTEKNFLAFTAGFSSASINVPPSGTVYDFTLALQKLEHDIRREILLAYTRALRNKDGHAE